MDLGDFPRRDYTLHISVRCVNHSRPRSWLLISAQNSYVTKEDGSRRIWRRFRVSGGLSLTVLADKVIDPLMGWYVGKSSYVVTTDSWYSGSVVTTCMHSPISMTVHFLDLRSDPSSSKGIQQSYMSRVSEPHMRRHDAYQFGRYRVLAAVSR